MTVCTKFQVSIAFFGQGVVAILTTQYLTDIRTKKHTLRLHHVDFENINIRVWKAIHESLVNE